jgi:hypothetical protein
MEASFAGKREYGGKGRWVKFWARLGCWISSCYGPFSLGARFETYEQFISLIFNFFFRAAVNRGYWFNGYGGTTVFYIIKFCYTTNLYIYYLGFSLTSHYPYTVALKGAVYFLFVYLALLDPSCDPCVHTFQCSIPIGPEMFLSPRPSPPQPHEL